ncbi:capsid protein [Capybara virus 11_cap1_98]|uniref:Capsid protein n=1 Tax=Capybara virus 11_cap1_98 TaxID=2585038 RepID=A0A514TRU7_9VIRU|nr:capsid protein [Capybara virus 11_cap1_98]
MSYAVASRRRRVPNWAPVAARFAGQLVRHNLGTMQGVLSGRRTFRTYGDRSRTTSGQYTTNQHDAKRQYRYKRMSRWKRRRARKRVRATKSVLFKNLATKTLVRNQQITSTAAAGAQQFVAPLLYGWNGLGSSLTTIGADDVFQVTAAQLASDGEKYTFTDAVLDFTVRNTTASNAGIEVDVYEFYTRSHNRPFTDVNAIFVEAGTDTPTFPGGGVNPLSINVRGVTPFELPAALSYIKIIKKTKFLMSGNQAFTYQMKDRRYRTVYGDEVFGAANSFARDRWTKGCIVVFKSLTGITDTASISVGATRVYRFKINEENSLQDGTV